MDSGTAAQGEVARASAEMGKAFAGPALQSIREAAQLMIADLNTGGPPSSVSTVFGEARVKLGAEFEADKSRAQAALKQDAKQSGLDFSPGAINEAATMVDSSISRQQGARMRALNFEEANIGLNSTNKLIANLLRTGSGAAQGALAFGGNASQSAQILSSINQQSNQQNSVYGSMIGTIAGGIIGSIIPGFGTVAGAGIGGGIGGAIGGSGGF